MPSCGKKIVHTVLAPKKDQTPADNILYDNVIQRNGWFPKRLLKYIYNFLLLINVFWHLCLAQRLPEISWECMGSP